MALAYDTLYEPVEVGVIIPVWLKLARDVSAYITEKADHYKPVYPLFPIERTRPDGSLTLEELMRLYHEGGQKQFFMVTVNRVTKLLESCPWNGEIDWLRYEDGKAPRLGGPCNFSIRDLNLVPNTYTKHFVFAVEVEARAYMKSL